MNAARAQVVRGRYDEAERALLGLLAWEREPVTKHIELATLRLLAIVQCVTGRAADARRSAGEALRLAEIGGNAADVLEARLDPRRLHFLDLDVALVERELARARQGIRSGPHAENMLRDLGVVASGSI